MIVCRWPTSEQRKNRDKARPSDGRSSLTGQDSLSSKSQFQDKLNLPRCVVLRKEPPKRGATDVQVWTSEDSAVKQVEELGAEL